MVREHASRFFLKNGVPLLYSGARPLSLTSAWVAAFEEPVVREIIDACAALGLTVHSVTATAVALRHVARDAAVAWCDDDVGLAITYADGGPAKVRMAPASGSRGEAAFAPAFSALADRAADLMDAAGAACVSRTEPLSLRGRAIRLSREPSRRRVALSATVCGTAVAAALLAPGVASWRVARSARTQDAAISAQVRRAERDARELASVTDALGTLASFTRARWSPTLLLVELTRALPEGSALMALQMDSAGRGSVVAVGPRAASVIDAVERVPAIASPEIVGPVTREAFGGKPHDRVTVRFHLVSPASP